MKRTVILLFFVFSLQIAFSQEFEMIRHQVALGETVRMISKKYKVEPSEIYRLNKFAIDGVRQGMVLQIMVEKKEDAETADETQNPSDEATQATPESDSLRTTTTTKKVTTVIKKHQPGNDETETAVDGPPAVSATAGENTVKTIFHTVQKGETLFSIARRYGLSVDEITSQNAVLQRKGLQTGQVLSIVSQPGGAAVEKVTDNVVADSALNEENPVSSGNAADRVAHTVAKGETLYSLSKKYNVSVGDIRAQNEAALKNGLQIGQVLYIGK